MDPAAVAELREDLDAFCAEVLASVPRRDSRAWGNCYLRGLMLDGRRESIQPMAERLHAVTDTASVPLSWRLYLPKEWAEADDPRRTKTGVPQQVGHRARWRLALDMVDQARSWGLEEKVVVADAGYGQIHGFRHGLTRRGLDYVVAVRGDLNAHPGGAVPDVPEQEPDTGRPALPRYRTPAGSLKDLALDQGRTALRHLARLAKIRWRIEHDHAGVPHAAQTGPKKVDVGLSLYQVLDALQGVLLCWTGVCSTCRRPLAQQHPPDTS
ncbi:transposase [Nocardiopsis sp. NPDC049922]|uniref:transposase n=1 Tax=Nocardiopsis sp. NPDC049922 TaxID=3155157 RepID=UPI0033CCEED0